MKKMISLLLTLGLSASLLMTGASGAYSKAQTNQADALNYLQLFLGGDKGYELDARLNRSQSVTLVLRMLGEIGEAEKGEYTHPFTDVPKWADQYVAYAYEKGYVKGYSETLFGGEDQAHRQRRTTRAQKHCESKRTKAQERRRFKAQRKSI